MHGQCVLVYHAARGILLERFKRVTETFGQKAFQNLCLNFSKSCVIINNSPWSFTGGVFGVEILHWRVLVLFAVTVSRKSQ